MICVSSPPKKSLCSSCSLARPALVKVTQNTESNLLCIIHLTRLIRNLTAILNSQIEYMQFIAKV